MFNFFRKNNKHQHEWEIIEKINIYPQRSNLFSNLYETKSYYTWTIDPIFYKELNDALIKLKNMNVDLNQKTKEEIKNIIIKILPKNILMKYKEDQNPIGIYILQKCKTCGELKETKTIF